MSKNKNRKLSKLLLTQKKNVHVFFFKLENKDLQLL